MDDKQSVSASLLGPQPQPTSPAPFHRRPSRRALCLGLAALAAIGVVSLLLLRSLSALRRPPADPTHPFGLSSHIARNLGLYSPWQPATASDYTVPRGCVVTQVNVVREQRAPRSLIRRSSNAMAPASRRSTPLLVSPARWSTCAQRNASTALSRSSRATSTGSNRSCSSRPASGSECTQP